MKTVSSIQALLVMFAALQCQFDILMRNSSQQTRDLLTTLDGMGEQPKTERLNRLRQLREIEEESNMLERRLLGVKMEICHSVRHSSHQWWRDLTDLQNQLETFQEEVRTAIRNLEGRSRLYRCLDRIRVRPFLQIQPEEIWLRGSISSPDIPSTQKSEELESILKWKSLNETLNFKDIMKGRFKFLEEAMVVLKIRFEKQNDHLLSHILSTNDTEFNITSISSEQDTEDVEPFNQDSPLSSVLYGEIDEVDMEIPQWRTLNNNPSVSSPQCIGPQSPPPQQSEAGREGPQTQATNSPQGAQNPGSPPQGQPRIPPEDSRGSPRTEPPQASGRAPPATRGGSLPVPPSPRHPDMGRAPEPAQRATETTSAQTTNESNRPTVKKASTNRKCVIL
ncbi:uncharacterized protein PAE49_014068 isoform 1-T1 [Odontesthes bonariensis]|uniref:uncharacterized protein LOC142397831 isoform X1 n=1 Tax=Odontesthes bonariensis TaxID=219752 RepID=UPI003F5806DB